MASVTEANKVTQFCELCGSDRETAEHVLDAHSWDLDRSIGFFMDHGGTLPSDVQQHIPDEVPPDLVEDPIRATDSPPARPAAPPPQPVSLPQYHTTVVEEEEDPDFDPDYERALAESRHETGRTLFSYRHMSRNHYSETWQAICRTEFHPCSMCIGASQHRRQQGSQVCLSLSMQA